MNRNADGSMRHMPGTACKADGRRLDASARGRLPRTLPQVFHRHSHVSGGVSFRKRFRLFSSVVAVVLVLSVLKAAFHWFELEFLTLNPLFTSAVAGTIFIIGFLLSSLLSDYKEADRLPAEIRVALEAINDDVACFAERHQDLDAEGLRANLAEIVSALQDGLGHHGAHSDMRPALAAIDRLTRAFAEIERLAMPPNFVVRLRNEQNVLRRCVFRISQIQRIQFVPSVYVLVQTLVGSIILLLLFLRTEGSPESAIIFGFIAYMLVYALYLIRTLEQPFRKGHNSVDDVSLFLLREFAHKLEQSKGTAAPTA